MRKRARPRRRKEKLEDVGAETGSHKKKENSFSQPREKISRTDQEEKGMENRINRNVNGSQSCAIRERQEFV